MSESLYDKLKSLGVSLDKKTLSIRPDKKDDTSTKSFIAGEEVNTLFGRIFLSRSQFQKDYLHGIYHLMREVDFTWLGRWASIPQLPDIDLKNIVFLDTETTGLSGGTGTLVFLTGIGNFEQNQFNLTQVFLRDPSEEKAYLMHLSELFERVEVIVTYNGKSFDIPLLKTRFLLNHIPNPFENKSHLDLLHLTRKLWKDVFPSRSMGYLESQVLELHRSEEEVPGWEIPSIYQEYLRTKDVTEIRRVFYHNSEDILSLACLTKLSANMICNPVDACINEFDLFAVTKIYQELGFYDLSEKLSEFFLRKTQITAKTIPYHMGLADLYKSHGDWNKCIPIYESLSKAGYIPAVIELAKYFEHRAKNLEDALKWTKIAMQIADNHKDPFIKTELAHRKERLIRKVGHE